MKKLFIYYSLTGNGDVVADYLSKHNVDIRKVITKKKMPKSFALRIMSGGFKASINYKDKLKDFDNNINDYGEIIIGTPIWNDRLSSPINTVLSKLNLTNKKLTFILYSGSGKSEHATNKIKALYKDANIINITEPLKHKDEVIKSLKNIIG